VNTTEMMERNAEMSSRSKARIAGVFYLISIAGCSSPSFVRRQACRICEAAATRATFWAQQLSGWFRIRSHRGDELYRLVGLFYNLFRPVSRNLSFVAAFFGLAGCITQGINLLNHFLPLILLGDGRA